MKFLRYLAEHPYSTITGMVILLRAIRAVSLAHPDARIDMALSVDVETQIVGGIMLMAGQDPKMLTGPK